MAVILSSELKVTVLYKAAEKGAPGKSHITAIQDKHKSDLKRKSMNGLLAVVLAATFFGTLFIGRYPVDPYNVVMVILAGIIDILIWLLGQPAQAFAPVAHSFPPVTDAIAGLLTAFATLVSPMPHTWPAVMDTVIWQIRLPRALAVLLVGAGLAVSGATFQGTFRNPLVSENILGVSAGAAVGAAIGILIDQGPLVMQLCAFGFGLLAVALTYLISRVYRSNPTLVLVLAGIIVASLFSALTSLLKYMADPYTKLPDITYWLMGSFAKISQRDVLLAAPIIAIPMLVIVLIRWRLNTLSMGDEEARTLGLDTKTLRTIVILCSTLITAAAVSISGMIGWVGLIIPHIGRMLVGPDHKGLIPATILIGAIFLLVVDTVCRDLTSMEIPVSIVTSVIGAPIFLYLLKKNNEGWT
jgi:iron complex transport system permease protein